MRMQILSEWLACPEVASFMSVAMVLHSIVAAGSLHIVYACPGFCAGAKDDTNEIVVRGNRGGPPFFFYNRSMIIGRDDTEEREKLSNV